MGEHSAMAARYEPHHMAGVAKTTVQPLRLDLLSPTDQFINPSNQEDQNI
jgi:hypothetical protein